jgi:hypothetical protein
VKGATGGRPPKPDGMKRNRNKPTHGYIQLPRDGRSAPAPDPAAKLTAPERKLWDRLWVTPEASTWRDVDAAPLTRYVKLAVSGGLDPRVLAELRNLEDRYLMSPYARRIGKVELEPEDQPAELAEVSSLDRYQFEQAG